VRTIGLLGGMSWESTALYYRLLNEAVRERVGGYSSARCVLLSVDFAEIQALQAAGDWERAAELLADDARAVERAGADLLVLCTNTMHTVADAIAGAVRIPLLHIADSTAEAVRAAGLTRVALLGTGYTMEQPFLVDRLSRAGLDVLVPDADDRGLVHRVIYDELVHGVVRDDSRQAYRAVVDRLIARGAGGVILGCTEIELLIGPDDVPVPTFPTTTLHVAAAVGAALAGGAGGPSAGSRRLQAIGGEPTGPSSTIGR
jgi:aspartate racemase